MREGEGNRRKRRGSNYCEIKGEENRRKGEGGGEVRLEDGER